jgi:hypothetical protein
VNRGQGAGALHTARGTERPKERHGSAPLHELNALSSAPAGSAGYRPLERHGTPAPASLCFGTRMVTKYQKTFRIMPLLPGCLQRSFRTKARWIT